MGGIATRWILAVVFMLAATPVAAQEPDWWDEYRALRATVAACRPPLPGGRRYANINGERDALIMLEQLLKANPAQCPGGPALAAATVARLLGNPQAPEADPRLLRLAWDAAERGLGMPRDEAQADRLGRLLWLYEDDPPPLPRWPEVARRVWLEQPATIALLEARIAQRGRLLRTRTAIDRLAALKLRRDLPGYDPADAIRLLDEDGLLIGDDRRIAFSRLATDRQYGRPNYDRARRALILFGSFGERATPQLRAELLRIGRLAAASARTPAERAIALRILFAAAMDSHAEEVAARDALIRRLGRVPNAALAPADAASIPRVMHREFAVRLGYPREGDPPVLAPIRIRALIAPDGHVALAQVAGSSGLARHDRSVLAAWAEEHRKVDLSATARGRFVWVDMPPVDPLLELYPG